MKTRGLLLAGLLLPLAGSPAAEPAVPGLPEIQVLRKGGPSSPAVREAWDRLVAQGPRVLPQLLEAMDTPDTAAANWLRTAFDQIVDRELTAGGQAVDAAKLLAFVQDSRRQGRARRLALEVVERLKPGTRDRLIPGWLDDPEFRYEAVALVMKDAETWAREGMKPRALEGFRKAFAATRDVAQAQNLSLRLRELGVEVSVAEQFGFLTDWYAVGPFDAKEMKGFKAVYPPEEKIDLRAELPGKEGPVTWKRYQVKEASSGLPARVALVNLLQPLGIADDAVAYAYTAFTFPAAQEVEFRGAADDNLSVWVNGRKEFAFEEYRNGVRLDRHRFRVKLQPGVNTVLVKVCQAPADPTNNEPNWEFLLRVVDVSGKGLAVKSALPAAK